MIKERKKKMLEKIAYETGYRIINGNVFTPSGKKLKGCNKRGYLQFHAALQATNGKREYTTIMAHRLLAYQIYGEDLYNGIIQVEHIDGKRRNNIPSNIRLVDKNPKQCSISECTNTAVKSTYCSKHHSRIKRYGSPDIVLINPAGTGYINNQGYKIIHINGQRILEHRAMMEHNLGRKLLPDENVHHKNGNRSDNRIENLELWNSQQPSGQRIEDKIVYAIEILQLYAPEYLKEN